MTIVLHQHALDNIRSGISTMTEKQAENIVLVRAFEMDYPNLYGLPDRFLIDDWRSVVDEILTPIHESGWAENTVSDLILTLETVIIAILCRDYLYEIRGWNSNVYRLAIRPWISVIGPIIVVQ